MTKEEKIKEAYGSEVWDCIDYSVQKNILSDSGGWTYEINENWLEKTKGIEIELNGKYCRPKSLKGIENNNGWIKIESEEDLPKIGEYYTIASFDNSIVERQFPNPKFSLQFNKEWWSKYITHYQPITKPDLPLY